MLLEYKQDNDYIQPFVASPSWRCPLSFCPRHGDDALPRRSTLGWLLLRTLWPCLRLKISLGAGLRSRRCAPPCHNRSATGIRASLSAGRNQHIDVSPVTTPEIGSASSSSATEIRHLRQSGHTMRGIAAALNRQSLRTRCGSAWRLEHLAQIIKQAAR